MESGCNKERHICLVAREGRSDRMPWNASKDVKLRVGWSLGKKNNKDSPFQKRQTPPTTIQGSGSPAYNYQQRCLRFPTSTSPGPWPPSNPACPPTSYRYPTSASPSTKPRRSLEPIPPPSARRNAYTQHVHGLCAGLWRRLDAPYVPPVQQYGEAYAACVGAQLRAGDAAAVVATMRGAGHRRRRAPYALPRGLRTLQYPLPSQRAWRPAEHLWSYRIGMALGREKAVVVLQPGARSPRWASPWASFTALQETLSQSEDDPSDASSVAGSETSLDLDSDPDDDDSSDGSYVDDSGNDSSDGEEVADLGTSYVQRISQYEAGSAVTLAEVSKWLPIHRCR